MGLKLLQFAVLLVTVSNVTNHQLSSVKAVGWGEGLLKSPNYQPDKSRME